MTNTLLTAATISLHVMADLVTAYSTAAGWSDFTDIKGVVDGVGPKGDLNYGKAVDGNDVSILLETVLSGE